MVKTSDSPFAQLARLRRLDSVSSVSFESLEEESDEPWSGTSSTTSLISPSHSPTRGRRRTRSISTNNRVAPPPLITKCSHYVSPSLLFILLLLTVYVGIMAVEKLSVDLGSARVELVRIRREVRELSEALMVCRGGGGW